MRVLLLSANTGEGHNSTAKAIMEALALMGVSCDLQDSLACLSEKFSKFVCNWHVRIYKHSAKLFDVGYRAMERNMHPEESTLLYEIIGLGAGKLWTLICAGGYDAVVCTHPFSAMMLTQVRKLYGMRIPSYFVATDYTCSPTVEQSELDGYFIPARSLRSEFIRAGIPESVLISSGIPVRQQFYGPIDRKKARDQLSLPQTAPVVLLMCGSMGCGPLRKIARELALQLPKDGVLVVFCGRNQRLYASVTELADPRIRAMGYTTEVPLYMDAADLMVTKPGGLSSTEAANRHLPMVMINAIGGCENRNFEYFLANQFAVGSTDAQEVVAQAAALVRDPDRMEQMRRQLEQAFATNSAHAIAQHVFTAGAAYQQMQKQELADAGIQKELPGHPTEKGGCSMAYEQTVLNLARSFAGESQARTRYTVYAQVARSEGYEWIARIFEQTAENEAVHAAQFLQHMRHLGGCADNIDLSAGYPFQVGDTGENLTFAASGELQEHDDVYPQFAEAARREGCDDTARLFLQIARIEGVHHNTFRQLQQQLSEGALTQKEERVVWRCLHCGYTYEGIRACDPCPVCGKPIGWQAGQVDERMVIPKSQG